MTSKTTTKAASPRTSSPRTNRKKSQRKSNRINRQRRLQKQLQILILERHSRRCIICHHPEREAIEEEFVHWRAPWKLSQDYKLADYRTVYRHARAAGLLLQRRERLHSALDAFVESVDDVTFTGDTILRAMRAYSCIDSHGRWTEIPTQVQFSTSTDAHPPQPPARTSNVGSNVIDIAPDPDPDEVPEDDAEDDAEQDAEQDAENALEQRVTALDVLNVIRKYSNQALPSDAIAPEDECDELEDDDSDAEEDAENALEELVTSASSKLTSRTDAACPTSSKSTSRSDTTACAASPRTSRGSPAQTVSAVALNSNNRSRSVTATACAVSSAQTVSAVAPNSNNRSRSVTATACAAPPAQALPRDVVRGQNPNDRSPSDRTDCAALPAPSTGSPTQPAGPQRPKPDADGLVWHPHPGYPNQEMSEPDAQGRVRYKIHMTTAASQLPSRETDAQRAAELIYRSVIKKYGNP